MAANKVHKGLPCCPQTRLEFCHSQDVLMSKNLLLLLPGLVGLGLLTYFCATHHRPHFEADLTRRSSDAIAGIANGAGVSAEGQIITLNGQVATEDLKRQAGEAAARTFGVEEVRNLLTVAAAGAPVLQGEHRVAAVNCQAQFNQLLAGANIEFQTGSAVLSVASHPLLDKLAAAVAGCAAASFEVAGHTDSRGRREMNVRLSQDRAESVVRYLQSKGVAASRMTAVGYGPGQPVATNDTAEGMRRNRRTEFKVKGL